LPSGFTCNPSRPPPSYHGKDAINTAECTKLDLRKAREAANLPRWKAAQELGTSEDTIKRWEDPLEKTMPTSADVSRMESVYRAPGLWYAWMHSNDEGFRDHFPAIQTDYQLAMAFVNIRHQLADVMSLQDAMERDAMDGRIDDQAQRDRYMKELDDVQAAIAELKNKINPA
jgi:hypothetical protein